MSAQRHAVPSYLNVKEYMSYMYFSCFLYVLKLTLPTLMTR